MPYTYNPPLPIIGYQNILTGGATISTNDGTPNTQNILTYDTSRRITTASAASVIRIIPLTPNVCDYIAVAGLNLDESGGDISIRVRSAVGGVPYKLVASEQVGDGRSTARLYTFDAQTVADIQINLNGLSPNTLANISCGKRLTMERAQYQGVTPASLSSNTRITPAKSESGQFLNRDIIASGVEFSAAFRHLSDQWYRENFEPFTRHAQRLPFYYQWNPDEDPTGVIYGTVNRDIIPSKMGILDFLEVNFDIMGHR